MRIKKINKSDLDKYLNNQSEIWKLGKLDPTAYNKGRIGINNGVKNKYIPKEELDSYLSSGDWFLGTLRSKPTEKIVYINNGIITKRVPISKLDDAINDGWVRGKLPNRNN